MNAYLTERSVLLQQFWSIRNIICILKNCLHTFYVFTWEAECRDIFSFLCLPLTCLFQNKTKISGKADENWALLPHSATSSVLIPFASLSSSFCSVALWVHLLFEQVWGVSISVEHHWASAVLHHCSCWLCHQPRMSCMCCMHPHTRALKAECVEIPSALGHLSCTGRGSEAGTSAVKSYWIHLSLSWMSSYPMVLQTEQMLLWPSFHGIGANWPGDLILWCHKHQPRLGSGLEHRATGGFPSVLQTLLVGGMEQPQLFWTRCSSPLQLLACLTCFVCCEQRTHKFSHPHNETQNGKKAYREKTPTYFYFCKVTFAFTTIMQIFTY